MTKPTPSWRLCFELLPKVSRTFALSITLLTPPMRQAVCLGYLLCRLVDTFEDALLDTDRKALRIRELQAFVSGEAKPDPDWAPHAAREITEGANPADLELLENLDALLTALGSLPSRDREAIERCFHEMALGMIEMQRLLDQSSGSLRILPTMTSLTRYCHYVAGVVGTLLTELFTLHSENVDKVRFFDLLARSEPFGQFLQKINILKDIPGDHAKGWCFIPQDAVSASGLAPEDLMTGREEQRIAAIAPVMRDVLSQLPKSWQYLQLVPLAEREYRLFLAYSLFFGVKTLELALQEPDRSFDPSRPLKITRLDVAAVTEKVNRLIDHPSRLERYLAEILNRALERLDPSWPEPVRRSLHATLGAVTPAVAR